MEFHEQVNGLDYRKVVFVLVSSVGGREVNDVAIENAAVPRHELHIRDFEKQVRPPGRESLKLPFTGHKCRLQRTGWVAQVAAALPWGGRRLRALPPPQPSPCRAVYTGPSPPHWENVRRGPRPRRCRQFPGQLLPDEINLYSSISKMISRVLGARRWPRGRTPGCWRNGTISEKAAKTLLCWPACGRPKTRRSHVSGHPPGNKTIST